MSKTGSIGLIGFDDRERNQLEVFLNSSENPGFVESDPVKSDALLVNLASADDKKRFLRWYAGRPDCPVVAVVDDQTVSGGMHTLKRPMTLAGLKKVLREVIREIQFSSSGSGSSNAAEGEAPSLLKMSPEELKALIAASGVTPKKTKPRTPEQDVGRDGRKENLILRWSDAEWQSLVRSACGTLPDLDLSNPADRRRLSFSAAAQGRFLEQINQAVLKGREKGKPVQLTGIPGELLYFPELDLFSYDLDPDLLIQMANSRFGPGELGCEELEEQSPNRPTAQRDELLWVLALFTSAGRVPDYLDPAAPLILKEMPDLSRFLLTPHAERIARAWYAEKQSATAIASALKIPQRYVFSFMVAADAAGLFERQ
ncbi:hypothetical protein [Marinobacterium lutimaris]|uniref:Uncharacterized protein n=1 Tax=Marinobacterium lutimaris TaxID=568106 RepID=A0A1H5US52_9GAMM|nr:hypothetical protein [Marinobacterium lutimaris]SEF77913.1 hypothetical protein SAMN05444390_101483 [Marinobacterium lutimaris]